MKFTRTYSLPGDPYAGVSFEPRSSRIVNPDGSVIFEASDVMVPATWSQVAVDVLAQKYCRKAGVPKATARVQEDGVPAWLQRSIADGQALEAMPRDAQFGAERDARQVFNRMAGCWTYWGWQNGYFDSESDAQIYYDEMCAMLARQIGAPNSPQWFNTGLHWAYGISGPAQGHWFVDPTSGEAKRSADTFSHPQVSACYILGIEDDLVNEGGIFDGVVREARIFKGGSGSGANFSKIRAAGEKLTERGAGDESEFAGLGDDGTITEHRIILLLDRAQNFLAAAAEEFEIDGEFAVDFLDQRQALAKPILRAFDFKLHHGTERGSVLIARYVVFAHVE